MKGRGGRSRGTDGTRGARVLLAGLLLVSSPGVADDWLQWGGPRRDFTVEAEGLAEWWPEDGPTVLWKRPLGEGYSSILVKGSRLFTMYRDGEDEVVVSLDARTGKTIWEHRYRAEIWPEMTRAFGLGPNATPLIVGGRIVSAGISGQIRCLDLASGNLLWQHDLPGEFGRRERQEEYGYSASPTRYRGKVIVLVGGTDHAVVALDPEDGSIAWTSEPGGISYAAPTVTTLRGRDQFVYFSPEGVMALDPSTGETLWHHEMEYSNGNHLTPIVKCDESHIWIGSQFPSGGGRLLEIASEEGRWTARQVWFETNLRASHWTSIRIGDFIYGSTGGNRVSLLTAFNWRTGEVAWRKRGFHKAQALYADGKLLFLDEDGKLTLARISPEKLTVLDSAPVTEPVSWTLPSLVGTTLYVRDSASVLALDLADSGGAPAPPPGPVVAELPPLEGEFGEFIRKVYAAEDKAGMIDGFLARQNAFPLVEGDSLVHFVFRGDVPDVAVTGNFLGLGEVQPLHRVEGTDLYFRSYRLAPAAHFEYRFDVFEERMPDPRNPRRLTDDENAPSVLTTAGWTEAAHLREPAGARGRLETFTWKSEALENEREVTVYLPTGYDSSDRRYPLVIVNYGDQALEQGRWANSLDNLIGDRVAPIIVAFVPRVSLDDYGPRVAAYAEAVSGELIPYLDGHFRTLPRPEARAITGIASGGFASAFLGLAMPEVVGNVAVQSFYFRGEAAEELRSRIPKGETAARFYVEWSINDLRGNDELQSEAASRELAGLLRDAGYDVVTSEVADGAGWGSWRARTDRILEAFFPIQE